MGGLFGVASKEACALDLFFGVDYHSHLGTAFGGMAVLSKKGFERVVRSVSSAPFRTMFEGELDAFDGNTGIGCISDSDEQPLVIRSRHGRYAIACVGKINNENELASEAFGRNSAHFLEGAQGQINCAELVASLIDGQDTIASGIRRAQELIQGSMTVIIACEKGIIAARDMLGRTPLVIGRREGSYCAATESFSYLHLGYKTHRELGPGEIVLLTPEGCETLLPPGDEMRICAFFWTYYGYPTSTYEGVNVEGMRYRCGEYLAKRDNGFRPDSVAGVPDSGTAHAIGYANASCVPFTRPFIKYTPTWPRSFTPRDKRQRDLIAKMKLIPVEDLIRGKELLLIEDSIVRGTQLAETVGPLYGNGAKAVHIRVACPPVFYGCKFLSFTRQRTAMELITRRVINALEGECSDETTQAYTDPDGDRYKAMADRIRCEMGFTSLGFLRLEDLEKAAKAPSCGLCTYCWSGKE